MISSFSRSGRSSKERLKVLFIIVISASATLSCEGERRSPGTAGPAKPQSGSHVPDASPATIPSATGYKPVESETVLSATPPERLQETRIVNEAGLTLDEFDALLSLYGVTREEFWEEARRRKIDAVEYVKYLKAASQLD